MGRFFQIMDVDGSRKVDKQDFYYGVQELGANITKREAEVLLEALDIN